MSASTKEKTLSERWEFAPFAPLVMKAWGALDRHALCYFFLRICWKARPRLHNQAFFFFNSKIGVYTFAGRADSETVRALIYLTFSLTCTWASDKCFLSRLNSLRKDCNFWGLRSCRYSPWGEGETPKHTLVSWKCGILGVLLIQRNICRTPSVCMVWYSVLSIRSKERCGLQL